MLPDFGWTELLVIAIVLIVVVGPKDLPRVLRGFSKTLGSARKMAGDFRKQFDDALSDAEMDEFKNIANDVRNLNPRSKIKEVFNPLSDIGRDISNEFKGVAKSVDDAAKSDVDSTDAVNAQIERKYTPDEHYPQLAAKRKEREAAEKAKSEQTAAKKPAAKKRAPAKKAAAAKTSSAKPKTPVAKKPASGTAKTATAGTAAKSSKAALAKSPATKSAATKTAAPKTAAAKTAPAKATAAKKTAAKKAAPRKAATPKSATPKGDA